MKKILFYLALFFIALGGCKKVDLPPSTPNDPVFSITADLDTFLLDWTAGDDDFYMFSEFFKDTFGIYTFTGRLAKDDNCISDCEESLTFSILGSSASPNVFDIDEEISIGDFEFTKNSFVQTVGYNYNFQTDLIDSFFSTPQVLQTNWILSSMDTSAIFTTFNEALNFKYFGNTDLTVRADILHNAPDTCVSSIETTLTVGAFDICGFNLDLLANPNGSYQFLPSFDVQGNASFLWNPPFMGMIDINSPPNFNGSIQLTATHNQSGCSSFLDICVGEDSIGSGIINSLAIPKLDFSVSQIQDTTGSGFQFSTAIIEYNSENGTYSSKNGTNDAPTFKIIKIEDFEDNELGQKTKKLTIEYKAQLCKQNGFLCHDIEGSGVIAIAYPD